MTPTRPPDRHPQDPFDLVASLWCPASPDEHATVASAAPRWHLPRRGGDRVVWGALPRAPGTPPGSLVLWSVRRWLALARVRTGLLGGWGAGHVQRVLPAAIRGRGLRELVRRRLSAGAVVPLHRGRGRPPTTRLQAAADAAGVDLGDGEIRVGTGGSVIVLAAERVLRVGLRGSVTDPLPEAVALRALTGRPAIPRLYAQGEHDATAWTLVERLPGRRPPTVDRGLVDRVVERLVELPVSSGPATAAHDDLANLRRALPDVAGALADPVEQALSALAPLGGACRHGDLWAGNLLVTGTALSGIVDWDAWHPAGTPGTDLLQLVLTEQRHERRLGIGAAFRRRAWETATVLDPLRRWWSTYDVGVTTHRGEALALLWWLTEVAGTLRRSPRRAQDPRWVDDNVTGVLEVIA